MLKLSPYLHQLLVDISQIMIGYIHNRVYV